MATGGISEPKTKNADSDNELDKIVMDMDMDDQILVSVKDENVTYLHLGGVDQGKGNSENEIFDENGRDVNSCVNLVSVKEENVTYLHLGGVIGQEKCYSENEVSDENGRDDNSCENLVSVKEENVMYLHLGGVDQEKCNSGNEISGENGKDVNSCVNPSLSSNDVNMAIDGNNYSSENLVYTCTQCSFSSNIQSVVQIHAIEHFSPTDTCQCPLCGVRYLLKSTLLLHLEVVHKIALQKLDCTASVRCAGVVEDIVILAAENISLNTNVCLGSEVEIASVDVNVDTSKGNDYSRSNIITEGRVPIPADYGEVNSTEILCEICNIKVLRSFSTIHANGHISVTMGGCCPICSITYATRATLSRHLSTEHNLNLDGTTDKVHGPQLQRTKKTSSYGPSATSRTKRIVYSQKTISVSEMKWQLECTVDIMRPKDIAPSTKHQMNLKKTSGVEKLFAYPARPMYSKTLIKKYMNSLRTMPVGNEDFESHAENNLEVEQSKPKKDSHCKSEIKDPIDDSHIKRPCLMEGIKKEPDSEHLVGTGIRKTDLEQDEDIYQVNIKTEPP